MYYTEIIKHLTVLNGNDVIDLQLDTSLDVEQRCRVYCGLCINCGECLDE